MTAPRTARKKRREPSVWYVEVERADTGEWKRIGAPFGDQITAERTIHATPFHRVAEYRRVPNNRKAKR